MVPVAQAGTLRRVVSTQIPTRLGLFRTLAFERDISNDKQRVETAIALLLGNLTDAPPLVRIHSQCFTSEVLGSLRCDCKEQLENLARYRFDLDFDGGAALPTCALASGRVA